VKDRLQQQVTMAERFVPIDLADAKFPRY
jgi:hypothetical protein